MHIVLGFLVLLFASSCALYLGMMVEKLDPKTATQAEVRSMGFTVLLWFGAIVVAIWIVARG